ncbi:MAG: ABC transporter permease, partial [Acetobacteraceae bacterium]
LTPVGWIALTIVLTWLVVCFLGPAISPYGEAEMVSDVSFGPAGMVCPPGETEGCTFHLLGTDYIGRDILSRILYGARTTIGIAFLATLLAYLVGVTLGIAAAVGGPRLDMVLSRLTDVLMSIPSIMKGLVVIAAVGSSIPVLIVTAGITYSSPVFRIARALAMDVAVNDFVEVARARSERLAWIIRRELLPNIVMPLATDFGVRLVYIMLFIASLSFLGLGVQPPTADWGGMVRENLQGLVYGSLAPIAPAIAIATLTISINLIVDDISASSGGRLAARML